MNAFRIPFLADRLVKDGLTNGLTGAFDPVYLQGMKDVISPADRAKEYC
jgi:hypothetical protein